MYAQRTCETMHYRKSACILVQRRMMSTRAAETEVSLLLSLITVAHNCYLVYLQHDRLYNIMYDQLKVLMPYPMLYILLPPSEHVVYHYH
jgi:hypothetical protein